MKNSIVFIFAHRETDVWSTPLAIVNEFKRREWDVRIASLFDDRDNYVDSNIETILELKPDIIMHMDWGRHLSPILSKLKNTGAYCVMEAGDDPQNFKRNSVKVPWFDLVLTPDKECVEKYKNIGAKDVLWWTHFADTQMYYPMNVEKKYVAVSSRGMHNGSSILDILAKQYEGKVINQNGWVGKEHTKFLNSGEMVIQHARWGEISRRIFEGAACGKLVLTDKLSKEKGLDSIFRDQTDIIYYTDLEDAANKLVYYHNHPEEREQIAKSGMERVLKGHTQIQRVDDIIERWQEWELLQQRQNWICQ